MNIEAKVIKLRPKQRNLIFRRLCRFAVRLGGGLLLLSLISLAWEYRELSRNEDEYLRGRYGAGLGWITWVEVISLGPEVTEELVPHFTKTPRYRRWPWRNREYFVYRRHTVRLQEAFRLAALWHRQSFEGGGGLCHEPGYALRFYLGPWKRAELTACWHCYNLAVPALFSQTYLGFDAGSSNGLALLTELNRIAPLPDEAAFNYTNAVFSQTELEARLAEVFRSGWNWQFSEWVNHSPQKAEFLAGIVARLDSSRAWEVK